jgi:hypothetical protein
MSSNEAVREPGCQNGTGIKQPPEIKGKAAGFDFLEYTYRVLHTA